jgi:hypothetical protein
MTVSRRPAPLPTNSIAAARRGSDSENGSTASACSRSASSSRSHLDKINGRGAYRAQPRQPQSHRKFSQSGHGRSTHSQWQWQRAEAYAVCRDIERGSPMLGRVTTRSGTAKLDDIYDMHLGLGPNVEHKTILELVTTDPSEIYT